MVALPRLGLINLCSILDRGNIGNGKIDPVNASMYIVPTDSL